MPEFQINFTPEARADLESFTAFEKRVILLKTIDLGKTKCELEELIAIASREPVLLLTADGKEFVLSEADDFDKEVESLRANATFQRFLEERSRHGGSIPIETIEKELGE